MNKEDPNQVQASLQLTQDDIKIIEISTAELNNIRDNQPIFNWDKYVGKWQDFVSQIDSDYSYTIYDYTNDLSIRGKIEKFLQTLPIELALQVRPLTDSQDVNY